MPRHPALHLSSTMLSIAFLSACALPEDNTLSRADLRAAEADAVFGRTLDFTDVDAIPSGTATYDGQIASDAIVNGTSDWSLLGDLTLEVDIADSGSRAGSGDVTGEIRNLNLFDDGNDGFDDQLLTGTLALNGNTEDGRIDALATGVIGAVLTDTLTEQEATWVLDLDGDLRDNFEAADVVTGAVTGGTTGAVSNDYDVLLTGTGRFYGERD